MIVDRFKGGIIGKVVLGHGLDIGINFFPLYLEQGSIHSLLNLKYLIHSLLLLNELKVICARYGNHSDNENKEESQSL